MEQKKIEQITLHLIVFGTIIIISVLARQTVLHYGWDEFSSYLILIVCSIVIGAIYLKSQNASFYCWGKELSECYLQIEIDCSNDNRAYYKNKVAAELVPAIVQYGLAS